MDSLETREIVVPDASRPIIRGSRSLSPSTPDSKRQPADRNRSVRLALAADPDFVERERADKTTIFVSLLTLGYEVHWKMFPCVKETALCEAQAWKRPWTSLSLLERIAINGDDIVSVQLFPLPRH